jgi:hypothetical protein
MGDTPLAPAARYGLAWCRHQQGDAAGAAKLLRPWLKKAPGTRSCAPPRSSSSSGARRARRAPETSRASRRPGERCSARPTTPRVSCARARSAIEPLRKSGRLRDAVRAARCGSRSARRRAARPIPRSRPPLSVERVYLCLDEKRLDDAERALERAAGARKDDAGVAEAAFFVGEARLEHGDGPRALELYDLAAPNAANPARDRALYKAGYARLKGDDPVGAERSFAELVARAIEEARSSTSRCSSWANRQHTARGSSTNSCASLGARAEGGAEARGPPEGPLPSRPGARRARDDWKGALEA